MSPLHPTHEELVDHIESFARRHGHADAVAICGDGLQPVLRDEFQLTHDVDDVAGEPCFARLATEWTACEHAHDERASATPPHRPLGGRAADLWQHDGDLVAYSEHRQRLDEPTIQDALATARQYDLEVRILPASYAAPNQAVHVLFVDE